jgi:hypothetical protein
MAKSEQATVQAPVVQVPATGGGKQSGAMGKMILPTLGVLVVAGGLVWWMLGRGRSEVVRVDEPAATGSVTPPAVAWTADGLVGDPRRVARFQAKLADGAQPTVVMPATRTAAPTSRPVGIVPDKTGAFKWNGLLFQVEHFDGNWQLAYQSQNANAASGYPRENGGTWELCGSLQTKGGGVFGYQQRLTKAGTDAMIFEAVASSDAGISTRALAFDVDLPAGLYQGQTLVVDGRRLVLGPNLSLGQFEARVVQIGTADGKIVIEGADGPMRVLVQDNVPVGGKDYSVRFDFVPGQGLIKQGKLKVVLHGVREKQGTEALRH